MKSTQAWGWLAAGVLAAGLNAAYHDGGLEWAHRVADQARHVSGAVVALASGHADQFLAEAETLSARNDDDATAFSDAMVAKADQAMVRAEARADGTYARAQAAYDRAQEREQAHCARMQAERARIEARMAVHRAVRQIPAVHFDAAFRSIEIPEIPAINLPRIDIPQVKFEKNCSGMRMSIPAAHPLNVSLLSGSDE